MAIGICLFTFANLLHHFCYNVTTEKWTQPSNQKKFSKAHVMTSRIIELTNVNAENLMVNDKKMVIIPKKMTEFWFHSPSDKK